MSRSYTLVIVPEDYETRVFESGINLTGYTVQSAVTTAEDRVKYTAQCNITGPASAGQITVVLTAAQTLVISQHFRWGAKWYVRVVDPSGATDTVAHGNVELDLE